MHCSFLPCFLKLAESKLVGKTYLAFGKHTKQIQFTLLQGYIFCKIPWWWVEKMAAGGKRKTEDFWKKMNNKGKREREKGEKKNGLKRIFKG